MNILPMKTKVLIAFLFISLVSAPLLAQDDLLSLLDEEGEKTYVVESSFKGTRVVNGHSTKTRKKNELDFLISHRFGPVNSGSYELFGLDQANIRLGLEYGITDNLDIGIGRSSFEKTYDGFVKWKFLSQKKGTNPFPVSLVWFSSIAYNSINYVEPISDNDRIGYANELLVSRKFSEALTLQIMPGFVHHNAVPTAEDDNTIYFLGGAFRYKLTKSLAITGEYYYQFNPLQSIETYNSLGIGVDIETGGHVFQLHFTNSRPTYEKGFITQTTDDFFDGAIRFGFNISRTFQLGQKRAKNW